MNKHTRYVGRAASLVGMSFESGLNGTPVVVKSHNAEATEFLVRDVIDAGDETRVIKAVNLDFDAPHDIFDKFPNAPTVMGTFSMSNLPSDAGGSAVLDFAEAKITRLQSIAPKIVISGSCRLMGNRTTKTHICSSIVVDAGKAGGVVEFEEMRFQPIPQMPQQTIHCCSGHVVFRGCGFTNNMNGVVVSQDNSDANSVTFEDCTFLNLKECAVSINFGHVTFVNCRFKNNCGIGVVIKKGGNADIGFCIFADCVGGVAVPNRGQATIVNCKFERMTDFAAVASNGSTLSLAASVVRQCEADGVIVEGGSKTTAVIANSSFESCRTGVLVANGSVNVSVSGTDFRKCKVGMFVTVDATGQVTVKGCAAADCAGTGHLTLSGDKCHVVVNNAVVPTSAQIKRVRNTRSNFDALGIKYGNPVSTMGKRILQKANKLDVMCAMCIKIAPYDAAFKRCGHCKDVHYCSKACQRAHWSDHFLSCCTLALKSAKLSTNGYISCNKCGQVEVQCRNISYCACSKCVGVVYCSKMCQNADWAEHKKRCKPFRKSRAV